MSTVYIHTKEQLYSKNLIEPYKLRKFLESTLNSEEYYLLFTRVANLGANFFYPIVNALYTELISITTLSELRLWNSENLSILIEDIIVRNHLNDTTPSSLALRRYVYDAPSDSEPSTSNYLGLRKLMRNTEARSNKYSYRDYLCYTKLYTSSTPCYFAYPSFEMFVKDFNGKVLHKLLEVFDTDDITTIFPSSATELFRELEDPVLRELYEAAYTWLMQPFFRIINNDNLYKLSVSSDYMLATIKIESARVTSMLNYPKPIEQRHLDTLVQILEETNSDSFTKGNAAYNKLLELSKTLFDIPPTYAISTQLSLFRLFALVRIRATASKDDEKGLQVLDTTLSNFEKLLRNLRDLMLSYIKVSMDSTTRSRL